jgi:ankyrin repeat protein
MLFQNRFFLFRLLPQFLLCLGILTHSDVQASSQTRLIKAIQTGKISKVERILSKSKKISFKVPNPGTFEDQDTVLTFAARSGNLEIVKLILDHSKDLGPDQQSKANRTTPLFIASQGGHLEIAELLIAHGADPKIASTDGVTPLLVASQNGHLEIVKLLIAHGADPKIASTEGATPLYIASQNGHADIVKLLIDHGADPNTPRTISGATPLLTAAQQGHANIVKLLIDHGADPNFARPNDKSTPLFTASRAGRLDIVKLLIAYGVDPTAARTMSGATPLHVASQQGYLDVVKLLIAHGADPNIAQFTTGTTPRLIAFQKQHAKVAEFLTQAEILPALISMNEKEFLRLLPTVDRSEIVELIHNYINWSYEGSQSAQKVYSHFLTRLHKDMLKNERKKKAYHLAHGKVYQPSPAFQTLSEIVQKYLDYFSNSSLKTLCFHALDNGFKNIGNYLDENPKLSPLEAFKTDDSLCSNVARLRTYNEPTDFDFSNVSPGISHHGTTLRQVMEKSADRHFKEN